MESGREEVPNREYDKEDECEDDDVRSGRDERPDGEYDKDEDNVNVGRGEEDGDACQVEDEDIRGTG